MPGDESLVINAHAITSIETRTTLRMRLIPGRKRSGEIRSAPDGVETTEPSAANQASASEPTPTSAEPRSARECPKCHEVALHRISRGGIFNRIRRWLGRQRLYTCRSCGWRGWLTKLPAAAQKGAEWPMVVVPPDFAKIDAAFKDDPGPRETGPSNVSVP